MNYSREWQILVSWPIKTAQSLSGCECVGAEALSSSLTTDTTERRVGMLVIAVMRMRVVASESSLDPTPRKNGLPDGGRSG